MNIIEAVKEAKADQLITNGALKSSGCFLRYVGNQLFHQYELIDGSAEYKYCINNFSVPEILSDDWEIAPMPNLFPKKDNTTDKH